MKKILKIKADGLPLFAGPVELDFYRKKKVARARQQSSFQLLEKPSVFLCPVHVIAGINASGKTSILKVIHLAIDILNNKPINYSKAVSILEGSKKVVFEIDYLSSQSDVIKLETVIEPIVRGKDIIYNISSETLLKKSAASATKAALLDFNPDRRNVQKIARRDHDFLSDDVSIVIAENKVNKNLIVLEELLSSTTVESESGSGCGEMISEAAVLLDPSIERLTFTGNGEHKSVLLKFKGREIFHLGSFRGLEDYLSLGTIKGIFAFAKVQDILCSGGILLADELENHLSKEIVSIIIRLFMDPDINKKGAMLIFTTHYPELLDLFDCTDGIFIARNSGEHGITVQPLADKLKRNDIKKSEAFISGWLDGATPEYGSYIKMRNMLKEAVQKQVLTQM